MAQMTDRTNLAGIGRRIAEIRREVGLTQEQLAEKAEISVVHLSNVERGKKMPGLPVLIRIAEALEVATDWILRANVPGTYAVANERIGALLQDCSNTEMEDLLRILEDVKQAIRRMENGVKSFGLESINDIPSKMH